MSDPRPDRAAGYLEAYCKASGMGRDRVREWVPLVAAARLAEGAPMMRRASSK